MSAQAATCPSPRFLCYRSGQWESSEKGVIVETPVSLTVNGKPWITFMCTPTDLEALAIGFLFNEGVLTRKEEIELIQVCPRGDNVDVWLKHRVEPPRQWRRTSGCTGGATAVIPGGLRPELKDGLMLEPHAIRHLLEMLTGAQRLYREVGGVHTSILSDGERAVVSAEDVGRHNSLDKIAGRCLLDGIDLPRRILVTTGRISSEMLQKAARLGASVVISRTSATSLSVQLAEQWGITLIGYARHDHFIVYAHAERIVSVMSIPVPPLMRAQERTVTYPSP